MAQPSSRLAEEVVQLWAYRLIAGNLEVAEMAMVVGPLEGQKLVVEEVELLKEIPQANHQGL
jgi:hypothetical protein